MNSFAARSEAIRIYIEKIYIPAKQHFQAVKAYMEQINELYYLEDKGLLQEGLMKRIMQRMKDELTQEDQ